MKKKDALELLNSVPKSNRRSKVNRSLSCDEVISIVIAGINYFKDDRLPDLIEKRVMQAYKNKKEVTRDIQAWRVTHRPE